MKSPKELALDKKIINDLAKLNLSGKAEACAKLFLEDDEVQALQEYANTVSLIRLGFNDHGPVHMRTVVRNAVNIIELLRRAGIKTSLEKEECGDFEDSLTAVILASMFHDLGMGVGRHDHELHSAIISYPVMDRILAIVYGQDIQKKVIVRTTALEGITGHMGKVVNSLEAGIVQVADGCDMTKGRARIPIALNYAPRAGHIHQFSANTIEKVSITAGKKKPIHIAISMSSEAGLFQVEEVLLAKINNSTVKPYIELFAQVNENTPRQYL